LRWFTLGTINFFKTLWAFLQGFKDRMNPTD
jgi:hypothetical protein